MSHAHAHLYSLYAYYARAQKEGGGCAGAWLESRVVEWRRLSEVCTVV